MSTRKKNVVRIHFAIENRKWTAQGPRIRVEGPTLQATRRRARKAAEELHGAGVEIESTLQLPASLQERISANTKRRAELRAQRAVLREDTVEILDTLRNDLGGSYEDAAEVLGVHASVLMRLVHTSRGITLSDEDED